MNDSKLLEWISGESWSKGQSIGRVCNADQDSPL